MFWRRLEEVSKTSWRSLEDVLRMSWKRLEDVLKTYGQDGYIDLDQDVLKTSSEDVRLRRTYASWSRRLVKTKTKDVFKTSSSRRMFAGGCDINRVFVVRNLVEPFTRLQWRCNRLAITHPKSLQYACKAWSLIDCQHTLFSILLDWHAKVIVSFALILHVETFFQLFFLQCQQLSVIWSYQQIVDVYSDNYKTFLNKFVINARVSIT